MREAFLKKKQAFFNLNNSNNMNKKYNDSK